MKDIERLEPRAFTRFCMSIGAVPSSYIQGLTIEEQLLWFCSYLEKEVIPAVNNNAEAVTELQNLYIQLKDYVDHYFDNLDVQEEINNKLDDMADSGELTDIIAQYLQLAGVLAYDTKADMKAAENLVAGSITKTLGNLTYQDGEGHFYKVRNILNTDVVDDDNIIALHDENLVAEKISNINESISIKSIYAENANVYITELKNITNIDVLATGGNTSDPKEDITNIYDYIKNNSVDYDLLINAGLFNTGTGAPVGYTIFSDGVGYDNGNHTSSRDVIGFDEDNNLISVNEGDISSISDLEGLGFVKAVTGFQTLIKNGETQEYSIDLGKGLDNFIGQLNDGSYIIAVTMARNPFNNPIDYDDVITLLTGIYDIKTLCVLDGGGSTQQYTKTMSIIPSTDVEHYLGRAIPTIIKFKVKE